MKKSKISAIKIHSDEWLQSRLAKFTSSEIHNLMGSGFRRYVRVKVGEEVTGKSAKGEIDVEATRWGGFYEAEAVQKFGRKMGLQFIIAQQLVTEDGSRFGSTPDGLIVLRISPDDTEYEVETVEVKCPITFDNYLLLFECETPQDLKNAKKEYYWQVLDQMDNCESLKGHFIAYHPDFKAGNMRHIEFSTNQFTMKDGKKEFPIYNDLKYLREQKRKAVEAFELLRDKLMTAGVV
ncbi:MAG TPA: YqaJ viral recombinase family protein [Agriterribacter sp.]|nr:YqaJ viral recombinase family protein [Agriterribacter sp.]